MPTSISTSAATSIDATASYDSLRERLAEASLLLGNGFSIACDPCYSYQALRKNVEVELPEISRALLDRFETSNLESVLRFVEDARWLAQQVAATEESTLTEGTFDVGSLDRHLHTAHERTCLVLAQALAADHIPWRDVGEERSAHAAAFLDSFRRIFTLNYDFLLYWTIMRILGDRERAEGEDYRFRDGFRLGEDPAFRELDPDCEVNLFYLHGALHLFEHRENGEVRTRKHLRVGNRGLVDVVQRTFDRGDSPLFVVGGRREQKLRAIRDSSYLERCFESFSALEGPLVVFGWAFGDSDRHLVDALAANPRLTGLYVSYYGDLESPANLRLRATLAELQRAAAAIERERPLEIVLFPSDTARAWG